MCQTGREKKVLFFAIASLLNMCNNIIFYFPSSPSPPTVTASVSFWITKYSRLLWTTLPSIIWLFWKSCCPKGMALGNLKAYNVLQCVLPFFFFLKKSTFLSFVSYSRYKEKLRRKTNWNICLSMGPADSLLLRLKTLQRQSQHSFELLPFRLLLPVNRLWAVWTNPSIWGRARFSSASISPGCSEMGL